jgi:DNA-binding PadR family transcriptional regulator
MKNKNFDPRIAALAAARFHHGSTDHHDHPRGHQGRGDGFGPGFGRGFGGFSGFGPEMMRDFAQAWGGNGRARKGDVRAAILSLLSEAPATGYALIKGIAERTDQAWRPSPGSVYPTLQQLVDEGLVRQQGGKDANGGRTDYELTDEGTAYVTENKETLDAAWQASGPQRGGVDREFMASIGKLFDAVKQFPRSATAEQREAATAKIDELRRELYRILAD